MTDSNTITTEEKRYFVTMENKEIIQEIDPSIITDSSTFTPVNINSEEELEACLKLSPSIADLANLTNITITDMKKKIAYSLPIPLFCKLLLKMNLS